MKLDIQLFAVSASLSASQGEQSISDNTTKVTLTWTLVRTSGTTYWESPYYRDVTLTCDGQSYSERVTLPYSISSRTVTHTFTITHNNDGTKSINYSSLLGAGNTSSFSDISNSGSMTLSTIPRASIVTATNADIGSATTITINRASSKFKHDLSYKFQGQSSFKLLATGIETSYGWTIPEQFYDLIPNSKTGTCTIRCLTFDGNTQIGATTTDFTVTTNEILCKPDLTAEVIDTNDKTLELTGDSSRLIKGFSDAVVIYSAMPKNGATISSITVNSQNVTFPTGQHIILKTNFNSYEVVATDSRGYKTTLTLKPQMINYTPLTVNASFYRTSPTTGEVSLTFSGNYFNSSFGQRSNHLSLIWYYKLKSSDEWNFGGELVDQVDFFKDRRTFNSGSSEYEFPIVIGNIFDYRNAYDFILYYSDRLIDSNIQQTVSKGIPIVNWDENHFNVNGNITLNEQEISFSSVNLSGVVSSENQLPNYVSSGTSYMVGNSVSSYLYVYNGTSWVNVGTLKGSKGDVGEKGDSGASSQQIVLNSNSWNNNSITVTATGVTDSNTVIVSPLPQSQTKYFESDVYCVSQSNNKLTFNCSTTPTTNLTIGVVII